MNLLVSNLAKVIKFVNKKIKEKQLNIRFNKSNNNFLFYTK